MPDMSRINDFLQDELRRRGCASVTAVDAAHWLDDAGLLKDGEARPGLPLRNLLRAGRIVGQRQEANSRWFIDAVGDDREANAASPDPPARTSTAGRRRDSDESYVIDLCDRVLGRTALRQHRFDFLRGDAGARLPCDAFYPDLKLVIEYRERQHVEAVPIMDRRPTCSGVSRGEQRRLYDQRRRDVLPAHRITLVELSFADFEHDGRKRLRQVRGDEQVIRERLAAWIGKA